MTDLIARDLDADGYKTVYNFFKNYHSKAIIDEESILFNKCEVWTESNLEFVLKCFDKEGTEGATNFWDRLVIQFDSVEESKRLEIYCLLSDLMALHYVFNAGSGSGVLKEAICEKLPKEVLKINQEVNVNFKKTDTWGRAVGGQYYNHTRPHGICYYALLALQAKQKGKVKECLSKLFEDNEASIDNQDYIDLMKLISPNALCLDSIYKHSVKDMLSKKIPHYLALLHAGNPCVFMPIVSISDVDQIIETFGELVSYENNEDIDEELHIVDKLISVRLISDVIKKKSNAKMLDDMAAQYGVDKFWRGKFNIAFYETDLKSIWHTHTKKKEDSLGLTAALRIKKQLILFGPPGTGKTFTAKKLAEKAILAQHVKSLDIKERFEFYKSDAKEKLLNDSIAQIQIHPNMGYEDFIGGRVLDEKDSATVSPYEKGLFWKKIDEAKTVNEKPYFIILDEINRTDLSRMMGECMSRLEYRDESVSVPNTNEEFSIPENVHIIGTMNEIDHSLERVDFAMRRRFIWSKVDFDSEALFSILMDTESDAYLAKFKDVADIQDIVERAYELNKSIKNTPVLGEKYHIGHSYFLDIRNRNLLGIDGGKEITNKAYKKGLKVLWEFSLKPILQSYEPEESDKYINTFEEIWFSKSRVI